jgi:cell division protein FtsN
MAKKRKQNISIVSAIIVAVIIGLIIGAVVFNPADEGVHVKAPEPIEGYDDSWGRLATPVERGTVTHILIAWTGAGATPKEPRTQEEARKLVESIWERYKDDPTEENWRELQIQYNEDSGPTHNKYDVGPNDGLIEQFTETGLSTEVGHARISEPGQFGYHLIRRER